MRVATWKHEGHKYFLNKLYSDTKKRIDDIYGQRIKGLGKDAATAPVEARQRQRSKLGKIIEMQAGWMALGQLKPFGTTEIFRKEVDKRSSHAQRSSSNKDNYCEETSTTTPIEDTFY